MYIISGCLLGENCRYNGGNNYIDWIKEFSKKHNYISVCPEVDGGLEIPRPPAEITEGRVINCEGTDVTDAFLRGTEIVWEKIVRKSQELGEEIEGAILKANSPSCGSGKIYDGTFSRKTIDGDGFLAAFLKEKGIKVMSELEINLED
ncbi:DUF523 domain-containing protein [Aminipila sp.]|uniref:DUF523 domain-containing protein n=1 Tax=Aminipila sp. TaxID=2060095 RepID=UPI00289F617F|nr:DUF523 domain-containing protein [Aminipila sp.]